MNDKITSGVARSAGLPGGDKHLFLAWTDFQRRQISMQGTFGFTIRFLGLPSANLTIKFIQYFKLALVTLAILVRRRPRIVWVQLPPMPLLMVVLTYRAVFQRDLVVVADCHNGVFRPPWSTWPGLRRMLQSCDLALIHNDSVSREANLLGLKFQKLLVLEDCPATIPEDVTSEFRFESPLVLFPAGFAKDEPVQEIIEAARRLPDVTFVLTGRLERAHANHDLSRIPENLKLTGFLPAQDFNAILTQSDIVLALTTVEGIQLSACNEAIGAGKPMVLSDTALLRKLFGDGAIFVQNDADAIVAGLSLAFKQLRLLSEKVCVLKSRRMEQWLSDQAVPAIQHLRSISPIVDQ
jgi:glycosyltransferase involved in cell wall biosynthesis